MLPPAPRAIMRRPASRVTRNVPSRLTPTTSASRPARGLPAGSGGRCRRCSPGCRSAAKARSNAANIARISSGAPRSQRSRGQRRPSAWTSRAVSWRARGVDVADEEVGARRASASAMAWPMPPLAPAPVTRATRPRDRTTPRSSTGSSGRLASAPPRVRHREGPDRMAFGPRRPAAGVDARPASVDMASLTGPSRAPGLLDELLDPLEEAGGRRPVDDAVVEGQAERDHLPAAISPAASSRPPRARRSGRHRGSRTRAG